MKTCSALMTCWMILVCETSLSGERPGKETPPRSVLHVAVLANETTLTGVIDRVGDEYRIQNGSGETLLPAKDVLKVCESLDQAYEYLRSRANLRDPDERVRLARWCLRNNLFESARDETNSALTMNPRHRDASDLLKRIQAKAAEYERTQVGASEPQPAPSPSPDEGSADDAGGNAKSIVGTASLEPRTVSARERYSPETLQSFVRRVQPVLLNGCGAGHCHGGVKNGGYELLRPANGGGITAATSRQNLMNTLALLNEDFPEQSPLLTKSLERHGGGSRPPLGSKDSATYAALDAWVKQVAPPKPRELGFGSPEPEAKPLAEPPVPPPASKPAAGKPIHDDAVKPAGFTTGPAPRTAPIAGARKPLFRPAKPGQNNADSPEAEGPPRKPLTGQDRLESFLNRGEALTGPDAKPRPAPAPTPVDEFDPLIFNLKKHGTAEKR